MAQLATLGCSRYLTVMTFDTLFDFAASVFFIVIGVWATIYAYGFVGDRIIGRLRWRESDRKRLRWLAPLWLAINIACLIFEVGEPPKENVKEGKTAIKSSKDAGF